jgi:hypothetical protein
MFKNIDKETAVLVFKSDILRETTETFLSDILPREDPVRIGPRHPFTCRKRQLNWAVHRMRLEKPRSPVTAGVSLPD